MTAAITAHNRLIASIPSALKRVAMEPGVQRQSSQYLETIGTIRSIDDFMANDRVYRYALKAFGLDDLVYAKAFVRRALAEGIDDSRSLANKLADPRMRELVEVFNFKRYGAATTSFGRTQQGTVDRFVRQTLEAEVGAVNEADRLALYFERKASGVQNPYALLADRALLRVTQVALGLPESSGRLDIDRQAQLIEKRLAVSDLKSPEKVAKFLTRFMAMWDLAHPPDVSVPQASPSDGRVQSIGSDLLLRAQGPRTGR